MKFVRIQNDLECIVNCTIVFSIDTCLMSNKGIFDENIFSSMKRKKYFRGKLIQFRPFYYGFFEQRVFV